MKRPTQRGRHERGFTLVELMVVVAIVTVLLTVALIAIRPSSYNVSVYSFAEKVSSELDEMTLRAIARRRWQRLVIDERQLVHYEAAVSGMARPDDDDDDAWQVVRTLNTNGDIYVASYDDVTHLADDDGVPAVGVGMGESIEFAPDGAGQAGTIFIGEESDRERARVVVFRASGASYVFDAW